MSKLSSWVNTALLLIVIALLLTRRESAPCPPNTHTVYRIDSTVIITMPSEIHYRVETIREAPVLTDSDSLVQSLMELTDQQ